MATLNVTASAGRLSVYHPPIHHGVIPWHTEIEQESSLLLSKIRRHYDEALHRIYTSRRPAASFLHGGLCLGLLDLTSNVIVNTLLLSGTGASAPPSVVVDDHAPWERRSLDGLVTFLASFFPYLEDWQAVRYLLLADADPLVAARIVAQDRCLKAFRSASDDGALKLALRCAAIAAQHPCPAQLADMWVALSHRLDEVASVLCYSPGDILLCSFAGLAIHDGPGPPPHARPQFRPWPELAAGRGQVNVAVPYDNSGPLRRVLLDTIHGVYLQALARVPAGELQSRYQRSLLTAGHCYGPFDPVTNIIVNAVWYDTAFPQPTQTPAEVEVDMVGTLRLMRVEAQSLYGLISYLCTHRHDLSLDQALRLLLHRNLNLQEPSTSSSNVNEEEAEAEALRAAAIAALHPEPDAQVAFLCACKAAAQHYGGGRQQLSWQQAWHVAKLWCAGNHLPTGITQPPFSTSEGGLIVDLHRGQKERRRLARISRKVKAALRRYESRQRQTGSSCHQQPQLQLHVVCGANEFVSGPDYPDAESCHAVYHRTHANFLAMAGDHHQPVLFFAELSNDNDDDGECCPVDLPPPCAEPARCLFCEHKGIRIVHPAGGLRFHGREVEFEKMVRGEYLYDDEDYYPFYTNRRMPRHSEHVAKWVRRDLEEDDMYLHRHGHDFAVNFASVDDDDIAADEADPSILSRRLTNMGIM